MEAEQFADTIPHGDPIALFDAWFAEARASEPNDANAMALATATPGGLPSVRMVLLKEHGPDGFVFYTNSHSRKGQEILANPNAALLFHWKSLRRQVRVEGPLTPVDAATADDYFASRMRDSQLGAVASDQSSPLDCRATFLARFDDAAAHFAGRAVERPKHWFGFCLAPRGIEFWQDRPHRLHERRLFTRPEKRGRLVEHAALPVNRVSHAGQLNRSAAFASIAVALTLTVLKGWAAWSTGSTAMLGSLADTALDLIASLVTLLGVSVAAQPDDAKHRFGHGKAEALAAIFQVTLIAISALMLGLRAFQQMLAGGRTGEAGAGIAVSIAALALTLALLIWQRHVIRRTGSLAIATDHVHYQSDLMLNLAVIAALALDQYGGIAGADPLFGFLIALWLAWGAWGASQRAIDQLMDKEWPQAKRDRFVEVLARHPELKGVHDLRTRTAGNRDFVQFHVWVDPKITLGRAHRIMDEIEARLMAEFPGTQIIIHPEPEGFIDEEGLAAEEVLPLAEEAE